MNYIEEVGAFYDWLETNSMAVSSISLWHALMHIWNKTGWSPEFTVAVSVLSVKTGLERRTIYNARNELKQRGRIDFKERKGNQCAAYSIIPFCCTLNAHNSAHNIAHNLSHNTSHNVSPLKFLHPSKDLTTKSTKVTKTTKTSDPTIKRLIDKYHSLFMAKFNTSPVVDYGKAGAIFKNLLKRVAEEKLNLYLERFFASNDPFIMENGYDIGVFKTKINKFITEKGGQANSRNRGDSSGDPISINLDVQDILDHYRQLFTRRFKTAPVIDEARDGGYIQKMLETQLKAELLELIGIYLASDDEFYRKAGYTIPLMYSQLNKLLLELQKQKSEYGEIDPAEYPGGPECKCGGTGILSYWDADANNGRGIHRAMPCPCQKLLRMRMLAEVKGG